MLSFVGEGDRKGANCWRGLKTTDDLRDETFEGGEEIPSLAFDSVVPSAYTNLVESFSVVERGGDGMRAKSAIPDSLLPLA